MTVTIRCSLTKRKCRASVPYKARLVSWLCFAIMCFFSGASSSSAQPPDGFVVSTGFFVDHQGDMTAEQVKVEPFQPFDRSLSLGYIADPVWIRLKVSTSQSMIQDLTGQGLVVRLTNPLLDHIDVFDSSHAIQPNSSHGDKQVATGEQILNSPGIAFWLKPDAAEKTIYIRVQTTSSMVFSVVVSSVTQTLESIRQFDLFSGVYLGLLFVFLVLAVAFRASTPDLVSNLFIVQQALAIVWSLFLMGYARQYLKPLMEPAAFDFLTNVVVVAYTFAVCQYAVVLLGQFPVRRWVKQTRWAPLLIFIPLLFLILIDQSRLALHGNAFAIITFSTLCMGIVLFLIDWKADDRLYLPRWLVTSFFVMLGLATPLATSVTLRVEPIFQNAFVGFFFTTTLAGLLMTALLLFRARHIAREAERSKFALELQHERNQEQARFLGVIAHEFKTPLSIMKMVVGSNQLNEKSERRSLQAIKNMDALLEKCLQAHDLFVDTGSAAAKPVDLPALLENLVSSSGAMSRVVLRTPPSAHVLSDHTLIRIVLANLLDNALKYGDEGEPITIELTQRVDRSSSNKPNNSNNPFKLAKPAKSVWCVRIENAEGFAGRPDPDLLFSKYYRSVKAHRASGTGLGLYLSRHVAQLLGGDLVYINAPRGVVFEFALPAMETVGG